VPPVSEGDLEQFLEDQHQEIILTPGKSEAKNVGGQEELMTRSAYVRGKCEAANIEDLDSTRHRLRLL